MLRTDDEILSALDFEPGEDIETPCSHSQHSEQHISTQPAALRYLFVCPDCECFGEVDMCFSGWGLFKRDGIWCDMCNKSRIPRDQCCTVIRRYK